MALLVKDRVQESSTTTGTGTFTLAGATSGFQTFSSAIGDGNTTYYAIVGGAEWEVGLGTVAAGTLARTTVIASSTGSAVSFSAGTKNVFCTYPASKAVTIDGVETLTNKTLTSPTLTTPALGTPASGNLANCTFPTLNQNTTGSAATFTSTTQNSQFNSIGVGTAASATAGEIRATNNVTAYYSDDRFKTNLGNIKNALDKVQSLNGFYYEANELAQSYGYEKKLEVGVSAQQVQAIMPEVVAPAPIDENYLTVRYERLVPLLIEAIKELKLEVNSLKGK